MACSPAHVENPFPKIPQSIFSDLHSAPACRCPNCFCQPLSVQQGSDQFRIRLLARASHRIPNARILPRSIPFHSSATSAGKAEHQHPARRPKSHDMLCLKGHHRVSSLAAVKRWRVPNRNTPCHNLIAVPKSNTSNWLQPPHRTYPQHQSALLGATRGDGTGAERAHHPNLPPNI